MGAMAKMSSKALVVGALGAGALLFIWKKQSSGPKTKLGIPAPNNSPGSKPRVDNQSQPWYTGPLAWATSAAAKKGQEYQQNPALVQSDLTSVIHSTSDIWGTVSGYFGAQSQTINTDDLPTPSDGGMMNALPATDVNQSNMLGAQIGVFQSDPAITDVSIMNSDPAASGALIDSSNSDSGMGSDNLMSA